MRILFNGERLFTAGFEFQLSNISLACVIVCLAPKSLGKFKVWISNAWPVLPPRKRLNRSLIRGLERKPLNSAGENCAKGPFRFSAKIWMQIAFFIQIFSTFYFRLLKFPSLNYEFVQNQTIFDFKFRRRKKNRICNFISLVRVHRVLGDLALRPYKWILWKDCARLSDISHSATQKVPFRFLYWNLHRKAFWVAISRSSS